MIALVPSLVTTEYEATVKGESTAQWSRDFPVETQWQIQALKAVCQLVNLRYDWDSYRSPPISSMALTASTRLIAIIDPEDLPVPQVFPVPGGGLQLEWVVGVRELELEILPDGRVEFLKVEGGQPIEEGQLRLGTYGRVFSILSWLTAG